MRSKRMNILSPLLVAAIAVLVVGCDAPAERTADAAAQTLLDQAYDTLPKRLAQSPRIGRGFIARNPEIPEVLAAWR